MKIFKNRGDIYITKSRFKSSKEQRILLILLAVILIFTIVFVALLSNKYHTMANFFGGDNPALTQPAEDGEEEEVMPEISGKTNLLVFETDDNKTVIHYIYLIHTDSDNLSYKVSVLSPKMRIDKKSITDIFETGGGASLLTKMSEYLGIEIDYFVQFTRTKFNEFSADLGDFIYLNSETLRFNSGTGDDDYALRINEGEQKLNGKEFSNLLRYYSNEKPNFSLANELVLYAVTQVVNSDNLEDSQMLFRKFIDASSTNITVRDFENNKDKTYVFSKKNTDVTVYSCAAQFDENGVAAQESVREIRSYFSK